MTKRGTLIDLQTIHPHLPKIIVQKGCSIFVNIKLWLLFDRKLDELMRK